MASLDQSRALGSFLGIFPTLIAVILTAVDSNRRMLTMHQDLRRQIQAVSDSIRTEFAQYREEREHR